MQPCPVRPSGSGQLSEVVRWMERELQRLQPVTAPGELISHSPRGLARRPLVNTAGAATVATVERLLLVTESTEYLFCQRVTDATITFYVAKPEAFYTTDGGTVGIAYPDRSGTENVMISNLDALAGERLVEYPVDPVPRDRWQRLTPAYRAGYSVIYAMKLAEPLEFAGGVTCTHIDLNIGDVRRWETLAPLDVSHEVPITFS